MFLAVLVNRPRLAASLGEKAGEKASEQAIEAKVAEIAQIAATAAGLDRPRGDQIQVSAVDFMEGARDLTPVPGITFSEVLMRQAGSRRPLLRITGPSELIEMVRSKLGARLIAVELRAEPVAEVSVVVDQTVLETQVKIWAERLKFAVLA